MTSSTLGTNIQRRQKGWSKTLMASSAALLLTVAAAVGVWQTVDHRESARRTDAKPAAVQAPAAGVQPSDAGVFDSGFTIYIVGSQEEAALLADTIAASDRLLEQFGRPPSNAQVVVVSSEAERAKVEQAYADLDAQRAVIGLTPLTLVDMRER
jgi:hypothetical protein